MIFNAVISNKAHPEYGVITIPFPIPDDQYDSTIDLLEPMGIGSPIDQDCWIGELDSPYPILNCLVTQSVNLDELDYLAKRLDGFCTSDDVQFQAAASVLSPSDIKDLINLTFCCQQATVIDNFSYLEQIGKDHQMNLKGGMMPLEEYQALDGKSIALDLIQSGTGVVTPYGVVYDNGMVLEQVYTGRSFPQYLYNDPLITLAVFARPEVGAPVETAWLHLPASERQIDRTLSRIGITSGDAAYFVESDTLPPGVSKVLNHSDDAILALNRMCQTIKSLNADKLKKLEAVTLMAQPQDAEGIRRLAENLEQFDLIPGIQTPEEYGRYMIRESGYFEYDINLEGFYNYRLYGEQHIQQEGGQFTECGYVVYRGRIPLETLMRTVPEKQHQPELQMGGMV